MAFAIVSYSCVLFFFFNDTATTEIYTLSLHDALPILQDNTPLTVGVDHVGLAVEDQRDRSEEHTSELQSRYNLVCRLLLEKKQNSNHHYHHRHDRLRGWVLSDVPCRI